jgi:hypothetical protein
MFLPFEHVYFSQIIEFVGNVLLTIKENAHLRSIFLYFSISPSFRFHPTSIPCLIVATPYTMQQHRLGIDPKLLAGILNTSSGRCWASDTYNPCPGVMEGMSKDDTIELE